ncbi:MAG TPA: hypothetical protein VGD65_17365 [Chryseosolibacter sp.]
MNLRTTFVVSLSLFSLFSCKEPEVNIDTPDYQLVETEVYSQLTDVLLDSLGFEASEKGKLVFYLGDTLAGEEPWRGEEQLLTPALATRSFSISEVLAQSQHKFIRATDTLRLEPGDVFTSRWLKFTRVRFNTDKTSGFLKVGVYCGNMCSWTDAFYIEKKDGRWRIIKKVNGPVA